ncbi:UNVERIFIED_CONTAM: hypothetical protein Sradi_4433800 [Sesamum radiatum]|uniref:Uncharacterized protein n=1 Tax=Sesamum radiatum TaxID=300843 RepID=A0AAW2NR68_SESRA
MNPVPWQRPVADLLHQILRKLLITGMKPVPDGDVLEVLFVADQLGLIHFDNERDLVLVRVLGTLFNSDYGSDSCSIYA